MVCANKPLMEYVEDGWVVFMFVCGQTAQVYRPFMVNW